MGCHNLRGGIICRVLKRRKRIDILAVREHDNAPRMLPGRAANPGTAERNALHLRRALVFLMLLIVFFNIAKRRFIRNRADGTRAEGMSRPENHLRVLVRLALVLAGEIQVDIRFLVPVKPEEGFKWDIVPVLY